MFDGIEALGSIVVALWNAFVESDGGFKYYLSLDQCILLELVLIRSINVGTL